MRCCWTAHSDWKAALLNRSTVLNSSTALRLVGPYQHRARFAVTALISTSYKGQIPGWVLYLVMKNSHAESLPSPFKSCFSCFSLF